MLKFAQDKFAGRKPTDFEQTAAFGAAREQGLALVRWQRRALCFGDQDALDDRRKFFAPTPCGIGIPAAKTRKGCVGTFKVGPPFKRRAIAGLQRDIERGFDIGRAVACER